MSDRLGLPLSNRMHVGGSTGGAEVIPWGSTEAMEAIKRTCQGVTVRCHQAMAMHRPATAPDEQVGAAT
jgi:hypothetical protein